MRENKTMWWPSALAGIIVLMALAACGGNPSSVKSARATPALKQNAQASESAAPSETPAAEKYQTKLERRGGKVRVEPVPASYGPKISQAEALAAFKTKNLFPETAQTQVADIRLGLFTDDETNFTGPAVYFSRPVWVIRYDNVPAEVTPTQATPGPGSAGPTLAADRRRVNILAFIDADTGQYLTAIADPVDAG